MRGRLASLLTLLALSGGLVGSAAAGNGRGDLPPTTTLPLDTDPRSLDAPPVDDPPADTTSLPDAPSVDDPTLDAPSVDDDAPDAPDLPDDAAEPPPTLQPFLGPAGPDTGTADVAASGDGARTGPTNAGSSPPPPANGPSGPPAAGPGAPSADPARTAPPAGEAPRPPGPRPHIPQPTIDGALELLLLEIGLLVELDAFAGGAPEEFLAIHRAYKVNGDWPQNPRRAWAEFLFAVDQVLDENHKPALLEAGYSVEPAYGALGDLTPEQRSAILSGGPNVLGVASYFAALDSLLADGTGGPRLGAGSADFDALLLDALDRLADPGVLELAGLEADNEALRSELATLRAQDQPPFPWLLVIAAAAAGGLLVLVVLMWRRRGRTEPTEQLLEIHRRLTATRDEPSVVAVAEQAITPLVRADRVTVLRWVNGGLRLGGTQTLVGTGALRRVLENGQPFVSRGSSPDFVDERVALLAVPLVVDGVVTGALAASRRVTRPFGEDERTVLMQAAPAVAAALNNADTFGTMEEMALIDGLTELGNRRRLDGDLITALATAEAGGLPVAFAMIDVDHFKHFNDANGHEAGDEALRAVARAIERTVRNTDVVYRYGGEEFSVLLPGSTPDEAAQAAERIREAVANTPITGEATQPGGTLTVSVGVSTLAAAGAEALTSRADEALYEAKARGRNQSVIL